MLPKTYTPEEVAYMLRLSKNTVYGLINKGEIVAKKFGKVYRIPKSSISFIFSGLDKDLLLADKSDKKYLPKIQKEIDRARKTLK